MAIYFFKRFFILRGRRILKRRYTFFSDSLSSVMSKDTENPFPSNHSEVSVVSNGELEEMAGTNTSPVPTHSIVFLFSSPMITIVLRLLKQTAKHPD